MAAIEGYASKSSVSPGDAISFHVRAEPPHFFFKAEIYRVGQHETLVDTIWGTATAYATPGNAYEVGCGWPAAITTMIPDDWLSGVYIARLTTFLGNLPGAATTAILFVVKAKAPGVRSRILVALTVSTHQAYNNWGGKSLYGYHSSNGAESNKVSFDRPGELMSDSNFFSYEYDFVRWLDEHGIAAEYCTSVDLHADPDLLNRYKLLVSIGHDEYWSWEMRDHVEAFVSNGGNVAFFSGNDCWWQVRFENNNRIMVCYRDAAEDANANPGLDPRRTTVKWIDPPVDHRENQMTGVSFEHGAGWWNGAAGARPAVGYRVRFPQHWVFAGTGLRDGDEFGADALIIGYEADAALYREQNGVPVVTGRDRTPRNFIVLGTADLSSWAPGGYSGPDGRSGKATMGVYRNRGVVFTAATTDWSHGLRGPWSSVAQITHNVLMRLTCDSPPGPSLANAGFERWDGPGAPTAWTLEGQGRVRRGTRSGLGRRTLLRVDARAGQTWISQPFWAEGRNYYRVGCWVRAAKPGATIRLQSTNTWKDFAIASHPGNGGWRYLCAVGKVDNEGPMFPARVKIQVAGGTTAWFDAVAVDVL